MEHVVFFPAADGAPAFRRVPTLDEAVRLVEHLRNVEGLATVSVAALTEVPLAFRAYYRVEVPAEQAAVPAQPTGLVVPEPEPEVRALALVEDVPAEAPVAQADEQPAEEPAAQPAAAAAGGAAPASLGFFA